MRVFRRVGVTSMPPITVHDKGHQQAGYCSMRANESLATNAAPRLQAVRVFLSLQT